MPYEITPNIDEQSPRIEQPDKIIIQLKEHQKALIYQARKLEEMKPFLISENKQMITQFGVICDHVGAGKSYEVLGTIAMSPSLPQQLNICSLTTKDNYVVFSNLKTTPKKVDTNMIVVPHGVLKQWEDYIVKHTHMKVYIINTFQTLRNIIKDYKIEDLYEPNEEIDEPLIDNLLSNLKSYKVNKSTTTASKSVRDTKYYRYLEKYFEHDSDRQRILNQYGFLDETKLVGYDIILISATIYNEVAFYFIKDNYFVNRLIFDEADSINIPNNLKTNALFYWFVTSSFTSLCNPDGIQKEVVVKKPMRYGAVTQMTEYTTTIKEKGIKCNGFIRRTFNSVEGDNDRNHYYLKNNDKFIEISFKLPDPMEHLIVCRDNLQIKVLSGIVSNDVMMMLNAGDTEAAIGRLTCEKGSEDNIITVVTQKLEQKILDYKKDLVEKQGKEYSSAKAKQEALERVQNKIKETREKIKSIEERIKGVECCDICFDDINNPAVTGCCQNVFCFSCLAIAISGKNICPKCRDSLTLDKIMIIKDKVAEEEENKKTADKKAKEKTKTVEQSLREIMDDAPNNDKYTNLDKIIEYKMKYFPKEKRKILIFSEHEGSFNAKMVGVLEKHGIVFSRIKGTSASINKTLREYRSEPGVERHIDALLINSRFFGAGLNLQNSSDIIILHRQGADILNQIIGRAQRLGRTDSLHIWKLYHNNEAYNYSN